MPPSTLSPKKPLRKKIILFALLAIVVLSARPAITHARAASLLVRFADQNATGWLADLGKTAVDEELFTIPLAHGETRARLFRPRGVSDAPGVVVVHGVHRLGIDEPRLLRFARAIASSGVAVLTPEVGEIQSYRIEPSAIDTLGLAARALRERTGAARVGLMGMSFAGGLALLAAADPRFSKDIGVVVAIGAHHDLGRVARYLATSDIELPGGGKEHLAAHEYGLLVLVHARAERFFADEDAKTARESLRAWLADDRDKARALAEGLSPKGKETITALFDHQMERVLPEILASIDRDREGLEKLSPRGHLDRVSAEVFLLHGAKDSVIPAAETRWLAHEMPKDKLGAALVSPAIVHVEITGEPSAGEQWSLVHFMASVLAAAHDARG